MEKETKLRLAIFGAGRIGEVHAKNIHANPLASVECVYDVDAERADNLARKVDARVAESVEDAVSGNECDGVVICSATNTHADLIEIAALKELAIFCEKPIDLDIERVERCAAKIHGRNAPIQLGFNRRFDPSHAAVRRAIEHGDLGCIQHIIITSRDPHPPHADYIPVSGGIFRDMAIHDFDMACFLSGELPVSVFASGECLVCDGISNAGDFDTATTTLRMASGALATIHNSRNCAYGYDQRIEVFGSEGMIQSGNQSALGTIRYTQSQTQATTPYHSFFQDRYDESYKLELDDFISRVANAASPSVGFTEGRAALIIANAAEQSARAGALININY